jgi:ribonuclease P protein component
MIGRMLRSADFERVLGTPSRARSPHFAVHFLRSEPSRPKKPGSKRVVPELSTGQAPEQGLPVDDSARGVAAAGPDAVWLGMVVPKRHARRAVTRNLIKRQIREAIASADRVAALPPGLWVVRLRAGFEAQRFSSPASDTLRDAAAAELKALLEQASRRAAQASQPVNAHVAAQ